MRVWRLIPQELPRVKICQFGSGSWFWQGIIGHFVVAGKTFLQGHILSTAGDALRGLRSLHVGWPPYQCYLSWVWPWCQFWINVGIYKSAFTLRTSSMMRMFSGLISRWKMPLRCMWSIAAHISIPLSSLPLGIYVLSWTLPLDIAHTYV